MRYRSQSRPGLLEPDRTASRGVRVAGVLTTIGNTPLVQLERYLPDAPVQLWAKLESANPGGSAKDRPAARMIDAAIASGQLVAGDTVVESTSGNMGIGLARACCYRDLRFVCIVDSRTNELSVATMRALGAQVHVVSEPDRETGDLLTARLHLVRRLLDEHPDWFRPDQYSNPANPESHRVGTMREIDEALEGTLDYLFVAAGTTGTLGGCLAYITENRRHTRVVAVDAFGSVLFGGRARERKLPGMGAGVQPRLAEDLKPDLLVRVSDLDCVVGCRRLARREAIVAGASSGGVMLAIEQTATTLPAGSVCAAILADNGAGYLGTVYDDDWVARELDCPPGQLDELVTIGRTKPPAIEGRSAAGCPSVHTRSGSGVPTACCDGSSRAPASVVDPRRGP